MNPIFFFWTQVSEMRGPFLFLHFIYGKKKIPSVLLTCVQEKNMWAKKLKKIWGIGTFGYVRSKTPIVATWLDPYGLWTAIAKKKSCDFWPFWPKMTCFCTCRFCLKNAENQWFFDSKTAPWSPSADLGWAEGIFLPDRSHGTKKRPFYDIFETRGGHGTQFPQNDRFWPFLSNLGQFGSRQSQVCV